MKEYRSDEIDISDAVAVKAEVMHDYSKDDFLSYKKSLSSFVVRNYSRCY